MSKHFDQTKYGKRLAELKGRHKGQRCFLIGNGPSLRAEDLTRLYERGEICFAFNRIYNIFDQTPWRPSYYISQDEKMLQGCAEIVYRTEMGVKLVPVNMKWFHDIRLKTASWFYMEAPQEENGKPLQFSDEVPRLLYNSSTGMYTAAQFAAYMGFKEIYLIGVDHHFHISKNSRGEIVVDNSVKDYFTDKYNEDKDKLYIPNTEKSTLTYVAMKEQCEKREIRVYNATRGGKLEVFERVDFDLLFE
jgi:hypothetical protein